MTFLIVDDSSTMRRIIINTLSKAGYTEFAESGSGTEALEQLDKGRFDVVIVDWDMRVMNGLTFVRAMRAKPANRDVPVLIVTTNATEDDIKEAIESGVNDCIAKPFTPEVVQAKVRAVTKKS